MAERERQALPMILTVVIMYRKEIQKKRKIKRLKKKRRKIIELDTKQREKYKN